MMKTLISILQQVETFRYQTESTTISSTQSRQTYLLRAAFAVTSLSFTDAPFWRVLS